MILALLLACAGDPADTGGACDRRPALSYENFGHGFLAQHCTGCHSSYLPAELRQGAPVGVDLDSYAGALAWAERIEARAADPQGGMPPGGGPTDEERARLAEWLACGVYPDLEEKR